jgi:hypothetical protein
MGEYQVGGIYWSTYWSEDGELETGENFSTLQARAAKAVEMLERGWMVAFGDFAGLQEKLIRSAKQYDETQAEQKNRVDELRQALSEDDHPFDVLGVDVSNAPADRSADLNDPLWPEYWRWFERSDPGAYRAAIKANDPNFGPGPGLARQEDFNCWKDHRQGILDAWNAWKHAHPMNGTSSVMMDKFIVTLPEEDQLFLENMPGLLD